MPSMFIIKDFMERFIFYYEACIVGLTRTTPNNEQLIIIGVIIDAGLDDQ